jgi:hypothetical protein
MNEQVDTYCNRRYTKGLFKRGSIPRKIFEPCHQPLCHSIKYSYRPVREIYVIKLVRLQETMRPS